MDKKTTQIIKGFAILTMMFHHFCGTQLFPDMNTFWIRVGADCKICIAIYAVLSGYGYFFAKEKTYRYSVKKIWGLLQIYWISLLTLFIPFPGRGGWGATLSTIFIQLFALRPNLNWFAWYVYFYIFYMLLMPVLHKGFRFKPIVNLALAVFVPYVLEVIFHSVPNYESINIVYDLFSCFLYFPIYLVGYLMAKHRVIERLNEKWKHRLGLSLIGIVMVFLLRAVISSVLGFPLDVVYAPLVVYFASNIFEAVDKCKPVEKVLEGLGKYSTGMWFFHAVFFSDYVSDIFQPVLLVVEQPVLMFIWLVVLTFAGAFIYQKILDGIKWIPKIVIRRLT